MHVLARVLGREFDGAAAAANLDATVGVDMLHAPALTVCDPAAGLGAQPALILPGLDLIPGPDPLSPVGLDHLVVVNQPRVD